MPQGQDLLRLQETLYQSHNPTRRHLHCSRKEWIVSRLDQYQKQDGSALEIGVGSGVYLPELCKRFGQVMATDIESTFLDRARSFKTQFPNLSLQLDDITSSHLPPDSFDLILCSEVIEHVQNSSKVLKTLYNILKPGGILILSTPQRYATLEVASKVAFLPGVQEIVRWIYQEPVLKQGHINLLTEKEARDQLHGAGFIIMNSHKGGLYLPMIAEFGNNWGMHFATVLEQRWPKPFSFLLWTQFYVAKKLSLPITSANFLEAEEPKSQ